MNKKLLKMIISSMCIGTFLTTSSMVYASVGEINQGSISEETSNEKGKELELQKEDVKDLQQNNTLEEQSNLNIKSLPKELELKNADSSKKNVFKGSSYSVSGSFSGTITEEGGLTYTTAYLYPNQILQATLQCPSNSNLDYDLYLYELNDDGTLGNCVDSSTTTTYFNQYPDGTSKTLDEGVSYINTGDSMKYYAVIIYSKVGASETDTFTLNLSLDVAGSYDAAEPNDNPYKAYEVNEGTISGANLNDKDDKDWYVWNVPADFNRAKIEVDSGYKVEVYGANGTSMALKTPNSNGEYNLTKGYYYIKVFSDSADFNFSDYTLNITPTKLNPSKIVVNMNGDMGEDFPSYPGGRYLRFKNTLSPTVYAVSESGYAVSGCPVYLYWESESWNDFTGNKTRTSETVYTGSDGSAVVSLSVPTSLGTHSYTFGYPKVFCHYYDIDYVQVTANGSLNYATPVYHFAYSDYIGG